MPNLTTTIRIDAGAARRPIDARIYGVAFATATELEELNAPLNRQGGNLSTRYNWRDNCANHGSDWYFETHPRPGPVPGGYADLFIGATREAGAEPVVTVPLIGWAAKTGPGDANVPVDVRFQETWLHHLIAKWGTATKGGVRYYSLDNEMALWHQSHSDVVPNGVAREEARDRYLEYARMIHAVDPEALVLGFEEWGYEGMLRSGAEKRCRLARLFREPYYPWLLAEMKKAGELDGRPPIDIVTMHFYPQGGEFSDDVSEPMQLRRNRSTRGLWDRDWFDESWLRDYTWILPKLRRWVDEFYTPGTPIGLTEYNWGAENHMNGATAQADVLGILGREGVAIATRWKTPPVGSPAYRAIQMYRNFGETSVRASVGNPDELSAFAALRADGKLTLMLVNKALRGRTGVRLEVANRPEAAVEDAWQLAGDGHEIERLIWDSGLPAPSVTLLILS